MGKALPSPIVVDWPRDSEGELMAPGTRVITPTGHNATLRFYNCALRFYIDGREGSMDYNGSLVFCDRWKPNEFRVIL